MKYPVEFTDDAFGASDVLAKVFANGQGSKPRIFIAADYNVVQRVDGLGAQIGRYMQEHGLELACRPFVVAGGEKIKSDNLQTALSVVSAILKAKLSRRDVVLAIGGGTLLDVVGYAAAQVRGGVTVVRMPTTPAAMMDAAFATYAAVDSATVKDALRIASEPAAVVVDFHLAKSVLDGVWRGGGLGEAVRQAVASDATLWKKLVALAPAYRTRDFDAFMELVRATVESRQKKGSTDFALWSAMRLEAMSGYKLPHGYAVPMGIGIDLHYAAATGRLPAEVRDEVLALLRDNGALDGAGHSMHLLNSRDELLCGIDAWALSSDGIVLPTAIGKSESVPELDRDCVRSVLENAIIKA